MLGLFPAPVGSMTALRAGHKCPVCSNARAIPPSGSRSPFSGGVRRARAPLPPPHVTATDSAPRQQRRDDDDAAPSPEAEPQQGLQQQPIDAAPITSHGAYLKELTVRDYALVERATATFALGLNAVTGESGAGKSVLLGALGALLGAPAPPDCVRPPAPAASVVGTFALGAGAAAALSARMSELGLPPHAAPRGDRGGGDELLLELRREIVAQPGGGSRSRCSVNGVASSLRVLRALGSALVDASGQHASLGLRNAATQRALLDGVAGVPTLAARVAAGAARLRELEAALASLAALGDAGERARLQKIVDVVDRARLLPGEEDALRARLQAAEARRGALEAAALSRGWLTGDSSGDGSGGMLGALRSVEAQLRGVLAAERQAAATDALARRTEAAARRAVDGDGEEDEEEEEGGEWEDEGEEEGEDEEEGAEAEDEQADSSSGDDDDDNGGAHAAGKRGGSGGGAAIRAALAALEDAAECLSDAAGSVGEYARAAAAGGDAERGDAVARLDLIERLLRSQRCRSTHELLAAADGHAARLEAYCEAEGKQAEWEAEAAAVEAALLRDALELSRRRRAAAGALRAAVEAGLAELAMPSSRFDVRVAWAAAPPLAVYLPASRALAVPPADAEAAGAGAAPQLGNGGGRWLLAAGGGDGGLDTVEFLLSAAAGEPLRPLADVASGGEAARVMLALKAAPAAAAAAAAAAAVNDTDGGVDAPASSSPPSSSPPILVLDEIDSGVGSRLGSSVGRLLRRMVSPPLPTASQVLCVTHLPQVAAAATHHVVVSKRGAAVGDGGGGSARASTAFEVLRDEGERAREVAAMGDMSLEAAVELVRKK